METYDCLRLIRDLGLILCILLLPSHCVASSERELLARSWPSGSDVRQQAVQALVQTHDGYLWVGTGKGLLRFDGVSFTAFTVENTPGMTGDNINFDCLWEDQGGVLWAGAYGQGLIRNDHGHFTTFGKEQGLPDSQVVRIDGDTSGTVWVYTMAGLVRWKDGRLERVFPEQETRLVSHRDGRTADWEKMGLWRRTGAGLERFIFGVWRRFPTPPGTAIPLEDDVRSIYEDRLRRVWYAIKSRPGDYFCVHDGELTSFHGLPADAFVSYLDRSGYLWLNDHGAHPARWKAGKTYALPQLHTASLLNVLEDQNGVIWAGGFHTELVQYRPRLISSIPTDGVPEVGSVRFRQRSGTIWAGGTGLLKMSSEEGTARGDTMSRSISTSPEWDIIRALSEDQQGRLLIGSVHHPGGQMYDRGRLKTYLPSFDHGTILAMLLASTGEEWIGTDHGLYRYKGQQAVMPQLVAGNVYVHCITETLDHTFWIGTTEGLLRFQDGHAVPLPETAVWTHGEVFGVAQDADGGIWMATAVQGIVRFANGKFRAFGTAAGLPTDTAYSVRFDPRGDLWVRSDVGLLRVRKQSIEPPAAGSTGKLQVMLLDGFDGLPAADMAPPGNQGSLALRGDTLWFATLGGIASIHPADFALHPGAPRAVLEEHVIDQSNRSPGSTITLVPGQHNLELHYTALGSRRPEQVTFRYRLRGFDQDWTTAGTRRVAYYTQLPPGTYSFEVQAANGDDGDWGDVGAKAKILVLTPFYRTWWMKALLCCLACGGLFFFLENRRRTAAERARLRQAFTHRLIATQEGERKRIAHELHDSLGQHLVLIRTLALLFKPSAPDGDHLLQIADQAAVAIQEVEAISYDLRPYQLDRLGLTKAILSLVKTFESSSSVRLAYVVDNIDGLLPKDMEINVYRIVQEALGNILKHAEATEVDLTVLCTKNSLSLVIRDNGRGFVPTASNSDNGGLGLIGISERAEALGGHAIIESAARAGTKIIVTVELQDSGAKAGSS